MRRTVGTLVVALLAAGILWAAPMPGDINGDGTVNFSDFLVLAANFGKTGDPYDPTTAGRTDTTRVTVYDTTHITVRETLWISVYDTVKVYPSGESVDPASRPDEITIASFNIRIYSTGSRDDQELGLIADRLQQFDLIAIQEVRDTEVVDRTLSILTGRGHAYQASVSDPVGEATTERYAFLWRAGKVQKVGDARIWDDQGDQFIREPYIATFRAGNFDFTLITIHVLYGSSTAERRAEAMLLDDVYRAVQDSDPLEQDVILLGDFNLEPEDEGFAELTPILTPLFTGDIRTTITQTSLYDNIWLDSQHAQEYAGQYGVDRFDQTVFGNDDDTASLAVSDHRPVWAKFGTGRPDDD